MQQTIFFLIYSLLSGLYQDPPTSTALIPVLLFCTGVDDEQLRRLRKPSQVKGRADFSTKTPHLILTLLPSDRVDNPAKKNRKKRAAATDATTCSRQASDQPQVCVWLRMTDTCWICSVLNSEIQLCRDVDLLIFSLLTHFGIFCVTKLTTLTLVWTAGQRAYSVLFRLLCTVGGNSGSLAQLLPSDGSFFSSDLLSFSHDPYLGPCPRPFRERGEIFLFLFVW